MSADGLAEVRLHPDGAFLVPFTCPDCGSTCRHLAAGRPLAGTTVGAVAECCDCGHQWLLQVTARRVSQDGRPAARRRVRTGG